MKNNSKNTQLQSVVLQPDNSKVNLSPHFQSLYEMGIKRELTITKDLIKNILNNDFKYLNVSVMCKEDRFTIYTIFRKMFRMYRPLKKQCTKWDSIINFYHYFDVTMRELISKINRNKQKTTIKMTSEIFRELDYGVVLNSQILKEYGFRWRDCNWFLENLNGEELTEKESILKYLYDIFYKTNIFEASLLNNYIKFELLKKQNNIPSLAMHETSCILLYPELEVHINLPLLKGSIRYDMSRTKEIIPHYDILAKETIIKNDNEVFCINGDNSNKRLYKLISQHCLKEYAKSINEISQLIEFKYESQLNEILTFFIDFFCNDQYEFYSNDTYQAKFDTHIYQNKISNSISENNVYIQETISPKTIFNICKFIWNKMTMQREINEINKITSFDGELYQYLYTQLANSITIKCHLCNYFEVSAFKTEPKDLNVILFNHFQSHYSSSLITWICSECLKPILLPGITHHCKYTFIKQLIASPPQSNVKHVKPMENNNESSNDTQNNMEMLNTNTSKDVSIA